MNVFAKLRKVRGSVWDQIEVVRKAKVFPVECVVRGFYYRVRVERLFEIREKFCGHKLPVGLKQCEQLAEPLFTPSTKATEGHDENISFEQAANLIGKDAATQLRDLSINTYLKGREYAKARGIIIADHKIRVWSD